jgi:predicted permease
VRDAYRALAASPLASLAAVASLALGIGASTAIFSIVDALLLEPLPVRDPATLVTLATGRGESSWPPVVWAEIRDRRLLAQPFAWAAARVDLGEGETDVADALWVSGGFFEGMGVTARAGRTLGGADDRPGSPHVVVISHRAWRTRFAGDPRILGRTIDLERVPHEIVGVTGPEFLGPEVGLPFDVALPLAAASNLLGDPTARSIYVQIMGRLAPGQTLAALGAALAAAHPAIRDATRPPYPRVEDRQAWLREPFTAAPGGRGVSFLRELYRRPLLVLLAIVALMLAVACVNVANLQLARAAARRREFAIRLAIGASRGRLARQLFTESLLLAAAGAAIGLAVSRAGAALLVAQFSAAYMGNPFNPGPTSMALDLGLDERVLAFAVAAGALTAIAFGTAPAWLASRTDPIDAIADRPRRGFAGRGIGPGQLLVATQVALSATLLVGAGLFVRTFDALTRIPLGFDPDRAIALAVNATRAGVAPETRRPAYDGALEAARSVPGVQSAAWSFALPISGLAGTALVSAHGMPGERSVHKNIVTPGWFGILGTNLVAGRDFSDADRPGAQRVAIVNRAFARTALPPGSPIGRIVHAGFPAPGPEPVEIVGLVEDAVYKSTRETPPPTIYFPAAQSAPADLLPVFSIVLLPASGHESGTARAAASAVARRSAGFRVTVRPMAASVAAAFNHQRVLALVASAVAAIALALVAVGVYGVTAHAVARRRIEIGIRIALGADARTVLGLILRRVAALAATGAAAGALASAWAAASVRSLLYGVPPRDPLTILGASAVVVVVALIAAVAPARRAARLDPAGVLRDG